MNCPDQLDRILLSIETVKNHLVHNFHHLSMHEIVYEFEVRQLRYSLEDQQDLVVYVNQKQDVQLTPLAPVA